MEIKIPSMTFKGVDVTLSMPYPQVTSPKKDPELLGEIKKLYASSFSELNCVLLYSFQASALGEANETGEILTVISTVEMKHLSLLAEVICKMGEKPDYVYKDDPLFLDTLDYDVCETEIIRKNMEREYHVGTDYERVISLCKDEEIKSLLERILADEKKHHDIFQMLREDRN